MMAEFRDQVRTASQVWVISSEASTLDTEMRRAIIERLRAAHGEVAVAQEDVRRRRRIVRQGGVALLRHHRPVESDRYHHFTAHRLLPALCVECQ